MQTQAIYPIHLSINFVFSVSSTKYLAEFDFEIEDFEVSHASCISSPYLPQSFSQHPFEIHDAIFYRFILTSGW